MTSLKWDRRLLVAICFIVISVGSAIYLSAATVNYLRFFPALGQLRGEFQVDKVLLVQGTSQSTIITRVSVRNPTDYSGFRLGDAIVSMFFHVRDNENVTLLSGHTPQASQFIGGQLGPHSMVSTNVILQLNPQNASSLASFNNSHTGQVVARVTLTIEIITFLDSVTGRLPYTETQDIPLS